jgi:hypothetical protein
MPEQRWTIEEAAKAIAERFIQKAQGMPVRRLEVRVAGSSEILRLLEYNGFAYRHDKEYFPRFRALAFVDPQLRDYAEKCTEMVLKALKSLYGSPDASSSFGVSAIRSAIKSAIDPTIEDEMIKVGMLFFSDFLLLFAGSSGVPGSEDFAINPRSEILGFESIRTAWEHELNNERQIQERSNSRMRSGLAKDSASPEAPDFSFVLDSKLRSIIVRDYGELKVIRMGVKSRIILCGGILEGLILDALLAESASAKASKFAEKVDVREWKLSTLLKVAIDLGFLSEGPKQLGHGVRDFRNLVHPGKEALGNYVVHEAEAQAAEAVLQMVVRDLSARKKNAKSGD